MVKLLNDIMREVTLVENPYWEQIFLCKFLLFYSTSTFQTCPVFICIPGSTCNPFLTEELFSIFDYEI